MNLDNFKKGLEKIKERFKEEAGRVRTGRASPDLINKIPVLCYNSKMPLEQTASISTDGARSLRVQPWDKTIVLNIEQAIKNSRMGFETIIDKETIKAALPELTAERRKEFIKLLKEKQENARVETRLARDEVWKETQEKEKAGEISEDEKFRVKDELQKIIDKANKEIEEIAVKKQKEIEF